MEISFEELKAAAESGNARAMGVLAAHYVNRDEWGEAIHWFIAAADNGDERSYSAAARSCSMEAHALRNIAGGDRAFQCIDTLTKGLRYAEAAGIPEDDSLYGRTHEELGICWYLASLGDDKSNSVSEGNCLEQARLHLLAHLSNLSIEGKVYLASTLFGLLESDTSLPQDEFQLMVQLFTECASSDSDDAHPGLCYARLGMISLGPALWSGWHYSPRDDQKAYECFVKAGKRGFDCSDMLSSFKKKMFGGYVYVG